MRTQKNLEKMQTVAVVAAELFGVVSLLGQPIFKIVHLKESGKMEDSFPSVSLSSASFSHLR